MTPPLHSPIFITVRRINFKIMHRTKLILEFKNSCAMGAEKKPGSLRGYGGAG